MKAVEKMEPSAPKKEKLKVVVVDNSEAIEGSARDAADHKLTASKKELVGVKGFVSRIWKHNLFHEYYRQKEIAVAKKKILSTGNIYANEGGDMSDHQEAMKSLVDRFADEQEEMLHAGEKRDMLGDEEQELMLKTDIKALIYDYAEGGMDDASFQAEKERLLSSICESPKKAQKGKLYADNLLEIAKNIKSSVEHGQKLEELDFDFDVVIGKAKSGVRTEAQFNAVDRITEKIVNSKIGRFANEATVASAVAIASAAAGKASQTIANSKIAAWFSFGATALISGGLAGARESRRLEMERKQHFREMAQGKKFDPDQAPRRKEMEEFRYETRDANSLISNLESSLYNYDEKGERQIKDFSQDDLNTALSNLAEIDARIMISDRMKIDLLSYSSSTKVEQERLALDLARAAAKRDLERIISVYAELSLPEGVNLREYVKTLSETRMQQMIQGDSGVETKNRMFQKMKRKGVAKAAMKGLATGLIVGTAMQEVAAAFSEGTEGVFEARSAYAAEVKPVEPAGNLTALESLRRYLSGGNSMMDDSQLHHLMTAKNNYVSLPEGAELVKAADGSYDLLSGEEVLAEKINFDNNGSLTPESYETLKENGVRFHQEVDHIIIPSEQQPTVSQSPAEFVAANLKATTEIDRNFWYDNDTPSVFEKNELKLWWGGEGNTGINADGKYVFDVKHMTPGGSQHGEFSTDAQQLVKEGKLKMILSLSKDTQNHVFEIPINENGQAIIDPEGEIGRMFFASEGGKAQFLGKYAEVAESIGEKNGVEQVRVLATHVGDGIDKVPVAPGAPSPFPPLAEPWQRTIWEIPQNQNIELPYFIPVFGRNPLEPIVTKETRKGLLLPLFDKNLQFGYYGYGEGYGSETSGSVIGDKNVEVTQYFSDLDQLKVKLSQADIERLSKDNGQFKKIVKNLKTLESDRGQFLEAFEKYKKRYGGDITEQQFKERVVAAYLNMGRNVVIENSSVGAKPFSKEFYEKSPVIKGIEQAEEIVVMFDPPLGDTILEVPIITSIQKYLETQKQKKNIVIVTRYPELFSDFVAGNSGISVIGDRDKEQLSSRFQSNSKRYILNANKGFRDSNIFNLTENEFKDEQNVLNIHYSSWSLEQYPASTKEGEGDTVVHYYPIPLRVMRNMELILGTKLFDNIRDSKGFWPEINNFESRGEQFRKELNIGQNDPILSLSFGSSVMPKEYEPAKWIQVLTEFCKKAPKDLKIVVMKDLDPEKAEKYQKEVLEKLDTSLRDRIREVQLDLKEAALLLKMSKTFLSPDTGLGHLASSMGTANVALHINNPLLWSSSNTKRVIGMPGRRAYVQGERDYGEGWSRENSSSYYVKDRTGKMEGASRIDPERVVNELVKAIRGS